MTSTARNNPLQSFILTPQQQNLLFAALSSGQNPNGPPANGAMNMSPPSQNESAFPNTDANGFQESPYLDYDYDFNTDNSLDFSFADDSQAKMIGDLPGTTPDSSKASSDNNDSEKRRHEEDEDEEGDAKRHETGEKVPKKPGRKPLTTEPSSKRKAQNRAAQRAFRERKEKHLKDLEAKVQELEKASQSASNENNILRAQVDKMAAELNEYKKRLALVSSNNRSAASTPSRPTFGHAAISNLNDVNFQFDFPKFGSLPSPPTPASVNRVNSQPTLPTSQSPQSNRSPSDQISPLNKTNSIGSKSSDYTAGLDKQTKDDLAKFSGIFSPPLTSKTIASASRTSMDSHYSAGGNSTSSPSASSNSNAGQNSSCGTSPEPFTQSPMGKPVDTLTTIGEEQPWSLTNNIQDFGHFAKIDMNDINFLASQNNFQFDPQLFGDYREPQQSVLGTGGFDDTFFNDAFDADFITPYNVAPGTVSQKKDLVSQIDDAKDGDDSAETIAPDGQLLTCNKVWEHLQMCPRVQEGDFDLDGLCADLQKKAKCSGSGAVVGEADFKSVMKKYLGKTDEELEKGCPDGIFQSKSDPSTTSD